MATCTFQSGGVDLNWDTVGNWDTRVPLADDIVVIPTGLTAVMNVTRIPAVAGKIASLTGTGTGGMTVNVATVGNCSINVTGDIQCGTKTTAFVYSSGNSNTLTIDAGGLKASTATTDAACYQKNGNHNLTVTATTILGGGGTRTYGMYLSGTGTMSITATTIQAGAGSQAHGVHDVCTGGTISVTVTTISGPTSGSGGGAGINHGSTACPLTLSAANMTYTAAGVAYMGVPPATDNRTASNYITWPAGSVRYAKEVAAGSIIEGVANGLTTGTYHEAAVGEVQSGVAFGPASGYTGTLLAGYTVNGIACA